MKNSKRRRSKQIKLWLTSSRQLVITFKRTKTSKKVRERTKQRIVPLPISSIKEVVIRLQKRRLAKAVRLPKGFNLNSQTFISIGLVLMGTVGTVYFGLAIRKVDSPGNVNQFSLSTPAPTKIKSKVIGLPRSKPTHLSIPSVGINADVSSVGRKANGAMEVPNDGFLTGWYKYSPTPGEIGPAIIVGHVDWAKIGPAVFWRLRELKPGDKIIVTRSNGKKVSFKVTALQQFEQNNFPTKKVYGNINNAGLRLITCGGTFNYGSGRYSHNTVVFASMITKKS